MGKLDIEYFSLFCIHNFDVAATISNVSMSDHSFDKNIAAEDFLGNRTEILWNKIITILVKYKDEKYGHKKNFFGIGLVIVFVFALKEVSSCDALVVLFHFSFLELVLLIIIIIHTLCYYTFSVNFLLHQT